MLRKNKHPRRPANCDEGFLRVSQILKSLFFFEWIFGGPKSCEFETDRSVAAA